jgi:GNAT superfamily N-acetyltransferase
MSEARVLDTCRGPFRLRPEQPEDGPFLFRLFRDTKIGILYLARIPESVIPGLIEFQHRSRTATYKALFPTAVNWIVEWQDEPIGLLIEHDETDVVHLVDFELIPERQNRGLGTALIGAVMREWAARGRGVRVQVAIENTPSLKLWRKLGFVETGVDESAYMGLRWDPPAGKAEPGEAPAGARAGRGRAAGKA